MVQHLQGKIALVFGAGSSGPGLGNGQACALAYARAGARVVAVDISAEAADATGQLIADEGGVCEILTADVADAAQVAAAVAAALERCSRVDILHNNVGIGTFGGVCNVDEADWDRTLAVNLKSAYLTCRAVLPGMERQGGGAIINISSIGGIGIGRYPFAAYAASKAGLNHLTRAIAVEYAAKGIRANAILPGLIDTPMVRGSAAMAEHHGGAEAMLRERHAQSPTGRMGSPWDVAAAAVFLASDDARYINGVLLPVDGGLSCRMG